MICFHEFTWSDHATDGIKIEWCPNCGSMRVGGDGKEWVAPFRDWAVGPAPTVGIAARARMESLVRHVALWLAISMAVGVLLGVWLTRVMNGG
jgi:hypothetical protein